MIKNYSLKIVFIDSKTSTTKKVSVLIFLIYYHLEIHSYIHTYIHTYMHTYIHTCIHTCILLQGQANELKVKYIAVSFKTA